MDLTTLNIDNYSDHELFELFDIEVENIHNQDLLKDKYNQLIDNMNETDSDVEFKNNLNFFLEQCYNRLLNISLDDKYDPEQAIFLPKLEKNKVFNNQHFIIKKNLKEDLTKLINPISRKSISKLLNINSLFRRDYYNTKSTDFVFELSQSLNNVISLSLETAEIKNTYYTFSDSLQTNQFSIELYNYNLTNANGNVIGIDTNTIKKKVIYIKNGNYTGEELEDYLNKHIFSHDELSRIACKYDKHTMKFHFFKDNRDSDKGGMKDTVDISYRFNIDFRIVSEPNREIQRNMGWILGYRKQKYTYDDDYIQQNKVTTSTLEGFNPEAVLKMLNMPYIYLSIDCFNNNHSQTIISPFEKSVINDTSILAKLTYNLGHEYNYDKSSRAYGFIRDYFGPVNISRIKVRILDPLGNIVDFNNNDISFTLKCEQVYDLNTA